MKSFVGYIANKIVKATPRSKKVAPTIKSVKPTKDIKGSVKRVYRQEESKRIDKTVASKEKMKAGKKMMREGQKELRKQIDTGRAFKFKHGTTRQKTFPIKPGENVKKEYKGLIEESKPTKKFKTAKQMEKDERRKREKEPFMGGGMAGRRMGYSQGSNGKIKFDAKKSDLDKSGDLSKYEKARGMAIAKAMAKRKNKKKAI